MDCGGNALYLHKYTLHPWHQLYRYVTALSGPLTANVTREAKHAVLGTGPHRTTAARPVGTGPHRTTAARPVQTRGGGGPGGPERTTKVLGPGAVAGCGLSADLPPKQPHRPRPRRPPLRPPTGPAVPALQRNRSRPTPGGPSRTLPGRPPARGAGWPRANYQFPPPPPGRAPRWRPRGPCWRPCSSPRLAPPTSVRPLGPPGCPSSGPARPSRLPVLVAPSPWSLVADIPLALRQLRQTYESRANSKERRGCPRVRRQLSLSQGCGCADVAITKQTAFGTQNLTALLKPPPKFLLPQDPYAAITATYIGNSLQCKHLPWHAEGCSPLLILSTDHGWAVGSCLLWRRACSDPGGMDSHWWRWHCSCFLCGSVSISLQRHSHVSASP